MNSPIGFNVENSFQQMNAHECVAFYGIIAADKIIMLFLWCRVRYRGYFNSVCPQWLSIYIVNFLQIWLKCLYLTSPQTIECCVSSNCCNIMIISRYFLFVIKYFFLSRIEVNALCNTRFINLLLKESWLFVKHPGQAQGQIYWNHFISLFKLKFMEKVVIRWTNNKKQYCFLDTEILCFTSERQHQTEW